RAGGKIASAPGWIWVSAPNSAVGLPPAARPARWIVAGRVRSLSQPSPAWAPPTRRRSTRTSTTIATRRASAPRRRPPMARGPARTFGQDLMRGEHVVGAGQPTPQNGGVLMPSHTSGDPSFYAKKRAKEAELGRELTT